MPVTPARKAAYRELTLFFRAEKYANLALSALDRYGLSPSDRALTFHLFNGVIQRKITMDYLLSKFSNIPLNKVDPGILVLLEMGLYQILWMDRVPDRAAVNESVSLAAAEKPGSSAFVNAVLRRAVLEKEQISAYLNLPGAKGLALRESFPRYLVSLWIEQYGRETAEAICREQNGKTALTVRINTRKTTRDTYARRLQEENIPFLPSPLCRNGFVITASLPPTALPGWGDGLVFVQDAAAQRAAEKLAAKPGDTVLDLCAAPGGKSFSLALDMEDRGTLLAVDLHPARVKLIENGAERLHLTCVAAAVKDASRPLPEWKGRADRVLCDVPCSGFGVIAKKPDIRLKEKAVSESLPALQGAILRSGADALKPGGRLVYATCTLNRRENQDVVDAFLAENAAFSRVEPPETIFPKAGMNDGFYIDVLEKRI